MRIKSETALEFKAVAELRGLSMSALVTDHIVKLIREEKARDVTAFLRALQAVQKREAEKNQGSVPEVGTGVKIHKPGKDE